MLLTLPDILSPDDLARARPLLAPWGDGRATAGSQSARVKNNQQLPEEHPVTHELQALVLDALAGHLLFFTAALPKRIFPTRFNSYGGATNA